MSPLEIDAIDAYYGKNHIIRDLSMSVRKGEICALLGRSDAGKTTTLRHITGATPSEIREGTIRLKDDGITGVPAEDVSVRDVLLVSEERRIFPNLSVAENLHLAEVVNNKSNTFGRSLSFDHKGILTEEVYDQLPRPDERRDQRTGALSDGEQQMLAIARVLKQNTDLLLLDRPYGGLAPKIIEDVEDAVERIGNADTTILLVEQNAVTVIELTDRAYVIDQGGIVFNGTTEGLRDDNETHGRYLGV